jgi:predicted dehydrogenase
MNTTRWAMVGTGLMLQLIGRDLGLTENVEPQIIVSRTQQRADQAALEFGFAEGSADLDAVLARDDIDVVYIATPHSLHFEQATAALSAGKHVLVEKAMTPTEASTRNLCQLARERGLFLMEAMWTAFNPAIIELRRRVEAGDLGEVRSVQANFCIGVPFDAGHRLWARQLAGGSTLDQGVYTLSLAHMLLGAPTSIAARGTVLHDVDAEVVATLGYDDGRQAVCISGLTSWSPLNAFVAGSKGYIEIPGAFWNADGFRHRQPDRGPSAAAEEFTYQREGNGYVPMLRAVSNAVLEGRTEHEYRTHAESIAVAATMDEVLRLVHG